MSDINLLTLEEQAPEVTSLEERIITLVQEGYTAREAVYKSVNPGTNYDQVQRLVLKFERMFR